MARKKTAPKTPKAKPEKIPMPIMPTRTGDEKVLIAFVDVSGKSDAEIAACHKQVNSYAPGKTTFALRTMRYSNGELAKISESEFPPKRGAVEITEPRCPKCGQKATDTPGICVKESYDASNPITWDDEEKTIKVQSAWHSTENFGDGNGDYSAYCLKCGHETADLEAFGLLDGQWDWD